MNGVILLPTLNRTKLLKDFIQSYIETEAVIDVKVMVDDIDYSQNQDAYDEIMKALPEQIDIVSTGSAISMGDKVRSQWDTVKDYKWVGILNDDHYCVTKHWDKLAESMLDGTNMLSTNDGYWNFGFRACGLTAWSMPLLEVCGFPIFPEGLQHLYIDDVWKAIGETSGCWLETLKINIEHRHVFNHKMEQDATFHKVNSPESYQADFKVYQEFMEKEFKAVCDNVVRFRSEKIQSGKFL